MLNNPCISSIQWTGINSFEVRHKDEFTKRVLPIYFKHSRYTSFARQLRLYQFDRDVAMGSRWMHKYLVQGLYKSLYNIRRRSKPQKQTKWQGEAEVLQKTLQKYQVKIVFLKWQIQELENEIKVGRQCYQAFQSELKEVQDLLKDAVGSLGANPRDKTIYKEVTARFPQYANLRTSKQDTEEKNAEPR